MSFKSHLTWIIVVSILLSTGCATAPVDPTKARMQKSYARGVDVKGNNGLSSEIISYITPNNQEVIVDHSLFAPQYITVEPGEYTITYACVPFGYHEDLKEYADRKRGDKNLVKTETFILKAGETIMPKHNPGIAMIGRVCGLQMVIK